MACTPHTHRDFRRTVDFQRMIHGISDAGGTWNRVFQADLRGPLHGTVFQRERMARRGGQPVVHVEKRVHPFAADAFLVDSYDFHPAFRRVIVFRTAHPVTDHQVTRLDHAFALVAHQHVIAQTGPANPAASTTTAA